mmetsp:Transcript_60190/g.167952  ORF Transcript_60190/g.167952 Transcript_60190/m.167952 type:complete len:94 (-) Transcript_60190:26-307(-)
MRTVADVQAQKCRHQERRARFEEQTRQRLLAAFLAAAGFSSVNEHKEKRYMLSTGFTYPLHVAVQANDAGATKLLLWGGADKQLQDSDGLTAL